MREVDRSLSSCYYRAVSADRLPAVLENGIDVEPTDSVIYADKAFGKAWEYGGFPKMVLALNPDELEPTYREVPTDTPADEIAEIRKDYPTVLTSSDGEWLWCSRLDEDDGGTAKSYERLYARWIPGNPFDALRSVFVFGNEEDLVAVATEALLVSLET